MSSQHIHPELHRSDRIGWLRAAVLGANDGILSVASIVVGVASASTDHKTILLSGVAGMTAGAMSMAAGEYVSVSSQADTEAADRRREEEELRTTPESELDELTQIYVQRGLDEPLAKQVAIQLTDKDALTTHLRDELGITEELAARPLQAAMASAASFAVGAALPLVIALSFPTKWTTVAVAVTTLAGLTVLGGLSASAGGAPPAKAATRVVFWGAVAMAVTSAIGWAFGVSVG
ncbi:VIT1/CCC1 transporter family protein [Planctomycetes bacterium TBK1r]|uniref:VIT family protein n=1 Tax=Stieleria magnilauensis TaxID=2527963 RepID=A0ABX5XX08_9BACT|nr:VIT family protein [Planctomycetes bacterium TBK1r]